MSKAAGTQRGYEAAVKRFPQAELLILRLLHTSEDFRELCEELADAELALTNVPKEVASIHERRTIEWQEMIEQLVNELEEALRH